MNRVYNISEVVLRIMANWRFKLLYDGECPFCRLEVKWLSRWNRHGYLVFEDITEPGFDPSKYGLTQDEVMGIIHGIYPDGRIVTRINAFREAYRTVGLGWLIAPTRWPILRWIFNYLYILFARYRVPVGRFFGRTCETGTCKTNTLEQPHHK